MDPSQRTAVVLPGRSDNLETVVNLLTKRQSQDYFAYEGEGVWYVGLGNHASLRINAEGKTAMIDKLGSQEVFPVSDPLSDLTRKFVAEHSQIGGKLFGQVGYSYGAHTRGQEYFPGRWPILSLMVPSIEVTLDSSQVIVKGYNEKQVTEVRNLIENSGTCTIDQPQPVDTHQKEEEYKTRVGKAIADIKAGQYAKVIVSRAIDLGQKVDIPGTMLCGRRSNTPARTFAMNHFGFQATGFSPELVVSVQNRKVITEPLAGTRSRIGTKDEIEKLGNELIRDEKEIVEHVISVKEAIKELNQVCSLDTVVVEDFMCIRERGSVQHLGSRVVGNLSSDKDAWNAFNVLFPSITASGIPKDTALQAIQHLETRPRELYSGAVLLLEGNNTLEATLCLRTVFQDAENQWIQAGAGIIGQSNPERELTETSEKLASIAPYVVYESESNQASASPDADCYVLERGVYDSIRLDAEHLLWRMYLGHVLHPQIPIRSGMKIAELGTGTGVWLFDAARTLPGTVELHGYDISDSQFPAKALWPRNVTLGLLNSLTDAPPELIGQYDVVHLRMWASNLKENNTTALLQHIKQLLKPGGYIQWEDADLIHQEVKSEDAERFAEMMRALFKQVGLDYDWVSELPSRLPLQGLEILQAGNVKFEHDLIQLCTSTYLMALVKILQGIKRLLVTGNQTLSVEEHEQALYGLLQKSRGGMVYNWTPITLLALKGV